METRTTLDKTLLRTSKKSLTGIKKWPYIFSLPFVVTYLAFHFYPVVYSFYLSLNDWNGVGPKTFVGFKNYVNLLTNDPLFYKSLYNTFLIMLMSLPVTLFLGMLLAYIIFNLTKGRHVFQTVNFLPYITTPVAIGFIFSFMFDWKVGLVNQLIVKLGWMEEGVYWLQEPWAARCIIAFMVIWKFLGYFMAIYLSGMTAIPHDLYEAARVDGSSGFHLFTHITLPLLKNITIFLVVTSIIGGWQLFDEPKLLYDGAGSSGVGGPENAALTVIWKFVDDSFISNNRFGYSSAIAYTLFVIIIIFSIASYKLSSGREEKL
ncbi:carbohydrate ABC transporter permease [Paenibacillus periandrae]|uniref:carbohydrate ABC transporter permease n=1 Tax=Paenibacillus periandrae TaxID=1761741 RepID=UPI001F08E1E7|nr:sugar ABC transporter permease [Paenibacillus periandrae]